MNETLRQALDVLIRTEDAASAQEPKTRGAISEATAIAPRGGEADVMAMLDTTSGDEPRLSEYERSLLARARGSEGPAL